MEYLYPQIMGISGFPKNTGYQFVYQSLTVSGNNIFAGHMEVEYFYH